MKQEKLQKKIRKALEHFDNVKLTAPHYVLNSVDANGYGISIKKTGYQFLGWKFNNIDYADEAELPTLTDETEDSQPLFKYG